MEFRNVEALKSRQHSVHPRSVIFVFVLLVWIILREGLVEAHNNDRAREDKSLCDAETKIKLEEERFCLGNGEGVSHCAIIIGSVFILPYCGLISWHLYRLTKYESTGSLRDGHEVAEASVGHGVAENDHCNLT